MAKHNATPARPSFLAAERRVARATGEVVRVVFYHVIAVIVINAVLAAAHNAHHLPVLGPIAALMTH